MFFLKRPFNDTVSQQPISQKICNSSNKTDTHTHALESLHIFLESNYKLVKSSRKYTVHHLFVCHQEFQY